MTPEERSLLERTYKLVEENNQIIKNIRGYHRWALFTKILYWTFIVLVSIGAYYLIQPLIEMIPVLSSQVQNIVDMVPNK